MRLDLKLSQISQKSRTESRKMIESLLVKVNGYVVKKPSTIIKEDDLIEYEKIKIEEFKLNPVNLNLKILFEDEFLAIIEKPAGIPTHPTQNENRITLVNGLLYHFKNLSDINNNENVIRPGIVHRLDKETSGLMIIAKTNKAHELISNMIQQRIVERTYHAICYSKPQKSIGTIEKNIRRDSKNRLKMEICKNTDGKIAITNYKVLRVFCENLVSLVECKLKTGRTHQIRIHFANMSNSIIGDKLYGVKTSRELEVKFKNYPSINNAIKLLDRHLLHSYSLKFTHPITKEELFFESKSNDIENFIKILEEYNL